MIFSATALPDVMLVDPGPLADCRGFLSRLHCPEEFAKAGCGFVPAQTSLSRNTRAGTLRGLHYRPAPHAETKLVRVTRGKVFDVVVDMRPTSATYRRWFGTELDGAAARAVLVPEGCAHGFLTLEDDTDVIYQIAPAYVAGPERGLRWDDPTFGIEWPRRPLVISARDASFRDHGA